jgi:serine/threonine protein kinase
VKPPEDGIMDPNSTEADQDNTLLPPATRPELTVTSAGAGEYTSVSETVAPPTQTAGSVAPPAGAAATAPAVMFGQYELLGEVARGGMGVVFRARQRGLDRVVALKMVLGADLGAGVDRFVHEAKAAAALDHPNVVPIYDCGEVGGRVYFTMAFVDGPDLRAYVQANGVPAVPHALALFAQTVAGVAHAHRHGIVHRDLKPANVLIDKDGRPRVTDFGLAKRASADANLTGTGQILGTPAYMAPEQARGTKDVGPPADVYALGAVLYFLLTGRAPFDGETIPDLLIKVVSTDPVPPGEFNPDVPAEVEDLCLRCLAKDPAARFPDANALLDAVAELTDTHLPRSTDRLAISPRPSSVRSGLRSAAAPPALAGLSEVSSLAPPAAPRRPTRLIPALAGGLLLGTLAILAVTRPWQRPEVAQTPTPDADNSSWPTPSRGDFGLTVEILDGVKRDADGPLVLPNKAPLKIRLKADHDCTVAVWAIGTDHQVTRIFPNDHEKDGRLVANKERTIPGDTSYVLETTPTAGAGTERLRVVATSGAMPAMPAGQREGEFVVYKSDEDRKRLVENYRGIVIKSTGKANTSGSGPPKVAETELLYRVKP